MNMGVSSKVVSEAAANLIAAHRGLFDKMQTVAEDLNRLHEYIDEGRPTDALTEEDQRFVAEIRAKRSKRKEISAQTISPEEQQRENELEHFLAAVEADSLVNTDNESAAFRKHVASAVAHQVQLIARRHLPVLVVTPYFVFFGLVEQTIRAPNAHSELSLIIRQHAARAGLQADACRRAFASLLLNQI